jgi:hypothetical protein
MLAITARLRFLPNASGGGAVGAAEGARAASAGSASTRPLASGTLCVFSSTAVGGSALSLGICTLASLLTQYPAGRGSQEALVVPGDESRNTGEEAQAGT